MKTELDLSRAPAAAPASLPSLAGMSLAALKAEMEKTGVDPKKSNMRAKQLRRWIHHFGVQDFAEMTDVAKELRAQLAEKYVLTRPEVSEHQVSRDGTQKWLTRYGPGIEGESVYIPDVGKAGALFPRRSAARSTAPSATPARRNSCVISPRRKSSRRC